VRFDLALEFPFRQKAAEAEFDFRQEQAVFSSSQLVQLGCNIRPASCAADTAGAFSRRESGRNV